MHSTDINHLPPAEQLEIMIKTMQPKLWAKCYPRMYENLGHWHSPKIPASVLAQAIVGHTMGYVAEHEHVSGGSMNQFLVAAKCLAHNVPTYFVPTSLLRAIEQTSPPPDLKWTELPLPHDGALFMFEKGGVHHPTDGEVAYASYGRIRTGEVIINPLDGNQKRVAEGGLLFATGTHMHPNFPLYDLAMSESASQHIDDVNKAGDRNPTDYVMVDGKTMELPMNPGDSDFNKWLSRLVIKIILFMLARPLDIQKGVCVRHIPAKKDRPARQFWSPTIIGGHYARQASEDLGGTHASPRMHWRRGHFRRQPHGEGRREFKTIWIEPMLIGEASS